MKSIRKWFCKPKRSDPQLLAQFYFANEELNEVSQELDSFDGRQDPERCTALVNHLRRCQDKVLSCVEQIMMEAIPNDRANRGHRAKFPEDVLLDSLPGQLWFGAECLGAGSTIMNREIESAALRPLARGLTKTLDTMRLILKEQCYDNINEYSDKVKDILKKFDETFAEFELSYVSTMVPVKSSRDYDTQQDVIVLFCETLNRALKEKLLTQDQVDDYEPGLMFTIPRLAIVSGLVVFPDGPLNMDGKTSEISELFRPFQALLLKIKELLQTLSEEELHLLEKALSSTDGSWEDIEEQLKLMGRGSKVRCHAAVQTDPTDVSLFETEGDESGMGGLMFGMSPIEEEVNGQGQHLVHMLGSSPNDSGNHNIDQKGINAIHTGDSGQGACGFNSFGVPVSDNCQKGNNIAMLSEKSGGNLGNVALVDDVDEHTLGMSPREQIVAYKISPKHKSLYFEKPVCEQARYIGQDDISDLYSMSPMEAPQHIFASNTPLIAVSPLNSPTVYCQEQDGVGELGTSPVTSHISDSRSQPLSQPNLKNGKECNNCEHHRSDVFSSSCTDQEHPRGPCDRVDSAKMAETIQGTEPHKEFCSPLENCKDQAIMDVCRQLVDDIVHYAVQYVDFTNAHREGRCCKGFKSCVVCSSCGKTLPNKDQYHRCTPKEGGASEFAQNLTNLGSSVPQANAENHGAHEILKTELDVQSNVTMDSTSETQDSIHNSSAIIREPETTSTFQTAQASNSFSNCAVPSSIPTDLSKDNLKCTKCQSPISEASLQSPDIIHSNRVTQRESFPLNSDVTDTSWESPSFGKGKPSTELSSAIPLGECLTLHNVCGSPPDNSNTPAGESPTPRHHSVQVSSPSSGRVYPASAINRVTGSRGLMPEAALGAGDDGARDRRESNVSTAICSSCGDELLDDEELYQWESDDSDSDSTSSMSDNDEHEIAIAIQAAELSARQEARSHFSSSWDLVHRLFVCIAGVADQLQTNYASDLRNILKVVFEITANPHKPLEEHELNVEARPGLAHAVPLASIEQDELSDENTDENKLEFAGAMTPQQDTDTTSPASLESEVVSTDVAESGPKAQAESQDFPVQPQLNDTGNNSEGTPDSSRDGQVCIEDTDLNPMDTCTGKGNSKDGQVCKEDSDLSHIDTCTGKDIQSEGTVDNSRDGQVCEQDTDLSPIDTCTGKEEQPCQKQLDNAFDELPQNEEERYDNVFTDDRQNRQLMDQNVQEFKENSNKIENSDSKNRRQEQDSASEQVDLNNQPTTQHIATPNQASPARQISTTLKNEQDLCKKSLKETVSIETANHATDVHLHEDETETGVIPTHDSTNERITNSEACTATAESTPAVKPKKKRHKSGDSYRRTGHFEEPPLWVPDEECSQCTACKAVFTMIRRKHHCRNCGKIFCSRCSANCVPLPKFGQEKPVRVCNRCYMFQVTPFQH